MALDLDTNVADLITAQKWLHQRNQFFNFKPSNTRYLRRGHANIRAGLANARHCIIGDSLNAGHGTGTGTNGFDGARALTPAKRMSEILNRNFINCQEVGIFGGAGVTSGQYAAYDPRMTLNTGWSLTSAGIGGAYYDNSTTTNALSWAPGIPFDTIEYWYGQATGYATFTIDVDGGAALETVNAANTTGAMPKRTVTTTLGTHTINWKRTGTGANCRIMGATVYNSAVKVLDVLNLGVSGAQSTDRTVTTNPWSPLNAYVALAADAYWIDLGMNDWINSVAVSTFKSNLQTLITTLKAIPADVILVNPSPRAVANTSLAIQATYAAAIYELAASNDIPLVDLRGTFETQEIGNALGEWYDVTHTNRLGAAVRGSVLANAAMAV